MLAAHWAEDRVWLGCGFVTFSHMDRALPVAGIPEQVDMGIWHADVCHGHS
jgi:hypothetical protein